jgi:4-hydroxybenzoate polyprenyltransferase
MLAHRKGVTAPLTGGLFQTLLLAVFCVVSARTAAMAFNRLVDARIDALNPRTAGRELPSKQVSSAQARRIVLVSSLAFLIASGALGAHCLILAPFVLVVLLGYSFTKRFTPFAHGVLGLALGLAPGGAWWVLRPAVESVPLVLMAAVVLWVAGFDILYSTQDVDFDRANQLHSVPARFGVTRALQIARGLHLLAFVAFLAVGGLSAVSPLYFVGMVVLASLLAVQHTLVKPDDLSRINHAFFTLNGIMSVGYLLLIVFTAN